MGDGRIMEFINKKFRVFRYEKDGRVAYTIGASKKNKEGKYDYAYKPVRFRKDVNLANKTEIIIKEGWEDFTNYTDGFGATKTSSVRIVRIKKKSLSSNVQGFFFNLPRLS